MDSGKDEEKGRIVSGLGGATTSSAWCRSRLIFSSRTRGRGRRLTSTRSRGVRSGRQSAPARRSWERLTGSYGSSGGSAPQSGTTGPTIGSRILSGRCMRRTPSGHLDDSPVEPVTLPTMWQRRESTAEVVVFCVFVFVVFLASSQCGGAGGQVAAFGLRWEDPHQEGAADRGAAGLAPKGNIYRQRHAHVYDGAFDVATWMHMGAACRCISAHVCAQSLTVWRAKL